LPAPTSGAVFLDPTGTRWRRIRRIALAVGITTTLLALVMVIGVLVPPLLPIWSGDVSALTSAAPHPVATSRQARERLAARRRLLLAVAGGRPPAAGLHPEFLPVKPPRRIYRERSKSDLAPPGKPITAGFYVNWDDNSFASFAAHVQDLDWVVCEWAFVVPSGDSLRLAIDNRVLYTAERQPEGHRPLVFAMVSNYDSTRSGFDARRLRRLLASPIARKRVVDQLTGAVTRYGLAGVTVDFENVPDDLHGTVVNFVRGLDTALDRVNRLTTEALPVDMAPEWLERYAAANDLVFLMAYDEHYGKGDVGPVASQGWYVKSARRALERVPPGKAILAVGAYGYDWNDADPEAAGTEMTFQDVMTAARDHAAPVRFDSVSLNPYVAWTDPDSTDHVVWFLDAATAYNQQRAGTALKVAGQAVWRLGSEDPSIWGILGHRTPAADPATALRDIPAGYDVQMEGTGELLRIAAHPTQGRREVRLDPTTALVTDEQLTALPSPWVVRRYGASAHKVALTFDDGPDGTWTPMILDTLRSRDAPATFFVIGANAERHIPLLRRIVAEGHEVGNHTFTHPNLALTPAFVTRLELDATERLIEAVLNRRSLFFRPPYFGDAEPTTADELVPVGLATDLGYVTAGLHVDSQDWTMPGADSILRNVLDLRARGNIVLLHDGGGDRTGTVAALGPMIDSLRARGDTLVLLSSLAGLAPGAAMPSLPPASAMTRLAELALFGLLGGTELVLYWVFLVAVVLGIARLVWILTLATIQRLREHPAPADPFAPSASIIVPAYKEEKVIAATIESLLAQDYAGPLEIVVVDDGSPDRTFHVATEAFGANPKVRVFRKSNGGKASALNYGIGFARGEIVVCLDADTVFEPGTLRELVEPLRDRRVGAVAGNAKVGNRVNLVTRWQAVEYVTSQNLDRRAFSLLNGITVVPGAVGAWRKSLVEEVGGFSDDTLAEDQDLTLTIRRGGNRIAYADRAVGWTEAPDTLRTLARQRFRWSFGTLQCAWKHRDVLFRPRYGSLGLVAMPNVWLFQLLLPAISPLADLLFLWSLVSVWLVKAEHGATYALTNLEHVLTFYAVFLLVDWLAAVAAFLLEPDEDRSLTWLIFLQRFAYRQVMYWVVVRAFLVAARGRLVGWGKLERKATVRVPA
jgi:cellulose synthase/poly-beta-1,6-N-acetylglucosamine synthase-like glycosyltransferase/peptidoglycan/xylan/chitin deacetylase (PgdA/CDA1 family)/spore germination protein YaaH